VTGVEGRSDLTDKVRRRRKTGMTDNNLDFHDICETFHPKIVRYLTHMVGGRDAEDLTQEVFVKVNQALKTFRGESQLSTWIYRIATNAALDRLRSPSFRQTGQKSISEESTAEGEIEIVDKDPWTGEKTPSVETSVIRKEMNACILGIVENLPENYQTVVVLSELEGFKDDEIAAILGVSVHTAKIRLHRARARLKRELEIHCNFYRDERNEFACDLKNIMEFKK
jgi:RNA polymerase sigma-70 factor (ECF subfamily)